MDPLRTVPRRCLYLLDVSQEARMVQAWGEVLQRTTEQPLSYRLAAYAIAVERIIEAINLRGSSRLIREKVLFR